MSAKIIAPELSDNAVTGVLLSQLHLHVNDRQFPFDKVISWLAWNNRLPSIQRKTP